VYGWKSLLDSLVRRRGGDGGAEDNNDEEDERDMEAPIGSILVEPGRSVPSFLDVGFEVGE
jgi:hypothetical protein